MEYCVNKKLDETHRYISEHDMENNLNATKMVIEKYLYSHDDDEWKKTEKTNKGEIHRFISEKVTEIHQDALDKVKIESQDDTIPDEMEKCVNSEEYDKEKIRAENEDEGVIQRVSTEY